MAKAVLFSIVLHSLAILSMLWSTEFSIARFIEKREEIKLSGVVEVNLLYKPTETAMRKGTQSTELPPPQVRTRTEAAPNAMPKPLPPKPKPKPKAATPAPKAPPQKTAAAKAAEAKEESAKQLEQRRQDMQALIAKMRQEQGMIAETAPREDNFPTTEDGEADARGTGGTAVRQSTPSQMALNSAMRKHFELPVGNRLKTEHPEALGYFRVRLVGVGNQFEIASLRLEKTSGFPILDRSCELAIRKSLEEEFFSSDVVADLTGKEEMIRCQP
jgi:outer membrane biosynthesis protein TonB